MSGPPGEACFGPYRILGVLGQGGMGQVLRAHDGDHERDVALKVLHPHWAQDEGYRDRFRREARIAARLTEPHVIPIHRYGEIDGQLFLDMRLVDGEGLDSLLRRAGPLDPARAVDLVGQVARALDAAHADGLVHRDVKPSNVLLVARADRRDLAGSVAGEDFAYLADFGIARGAGDGPGPALTAAGTAVGSTEYMAPERFGPTPPDARADVYSLACLLFELVTGRRPFVPPDPARLMAAHLHEQPPSPSSLRPGLPPALDDVVLRGLAKDPADRWQRAGDLAAAARSAPAVTGGAPPAAGAVTAVAPAAGAGGRPVTRQVPVPAPPPATLVGPVAGTPAPVRRRRGWLPWLVAAAAALVAVVLAGALVATGQRTGAGVGGGAGDDAADGAVDPPGVAERLLAVGLPEEVDPDDCTAGAPTGTELHRLECPAGDRDDRGAPAATYAVYAGDGAATGLAGFIESEGLSRRNSEYECGYGEDPEGWVQLTGSDEDPVGRLVCAVDAEGDAQLRWTWDDLGTLAVAEVRGGGEDALPELVSWWDRAADRRT
ncbi:serine/threonine protein kinase [Geodermatophilus pulveris]|uniref:non-specific serine/threonine protein kinase n=1 Tax=Geodermatophilus pulveris TaxID=1564159 RepID=A0A239B697_9ACTN|nr:serine/threonine-protein kinase [Geodermatophilus pulveris]SNS02778.1 serine/threonine protein kinase [Geodermatophilus pulveris]